MEEKKDIVPTPTEAGRNDKNLILIAASAALILVLSSFMAFNYHQDETVLGAINKKPVSKSIEKKAILEPKPSKSTTNTQLDADLRLLDQKLAQWDKEFRDIDSSLNDKSGNLE